MRAPWNGAARVLDGKATAAALKAELKERVAVLRERGVTPGLGTILVGEDPGSVKYVAGKHADCAEVGILSIREDLPATATQAEVAAAVDRLNADDACTGYIVQLPLPAGVDTNAILERVDPAKDADGLHPTNLGRLVLRASGPIDSPLPCTPRGCIELMERHGIDLAGRNVCVVGRGVTVGRSIGLLLGRQDVHATGSGRARAAGRRRHLGCRQPRHHHPGDGRPRRRRPGCGCLARRRPRHRQGPHRR